MKTNCANCDHCTRFIKRLGDVPPMWQMFFDCLWKNFYGDNYPQFAEMTCGDRYDFLMAIEGDARYYSTQDMIHPCQHNLARFFDDNKFFLALCDLMDTWDPKFAKTTLKTTLEPFFKMIPADHKLTDSEWIAFTKGAIGRFATDLLAEQVMESGTMPLFEMFMA